MTPMIATIAIATSSSISVKPRLACAIIRVSGARRPFRSPAFVSAAFATPSRARRPTTAPPGGANHGENRRRRRLDESRDFVHDALGIVGRANRHVDAAQVRHGRLVDTTISQRHCLPANSTSSS